MDYSITSKLSVHSALNGVKLPIIWPLLKSFSIKQFCGKPQGSHWKQSFKPLSALPSKVLENKTYEKET